MQRYHHGLCRRLTPQAPADPRRRRLTPGGAG